MYYAFLIDEHVAVKNIASHPSWRASLSRHAATDIRRYAFLNGPDHCAAHAGRTGCDG